MHRYGEYMTATRSFGPGFQLQLATTTDSLITLRLHVFPQTAEIKRTCTYSSPPNDTCTQPCSCSHQPALLPYEGHIECVTGQQQCGCSAASSHVRHLSFYYCFYSLDLTHIFLDKNSRQVIDNDFCSGLMQVCCKAGVILITQARKEGGWDTAA